MTLVRTTEAAILWKNNSPLVVDEIELPDALQVGQVLVELISSGICGAQINEIDAVKGPDKFLPHLLGHEGFCRVLDVGTGVKNVRSGDLAIMHWRPGKGIQSEPPNYKWKGKSLNAGWVTTFNKHAIVSENRLTKILPQETDKLTLPLLGCALTTALGVLENEARVSFRDKLLIFGAGGVGLALIKLARYLGVSDITIVDLDSSKLELARRLGATSTILFSSKENCESQIREQYVNFLPSVAIDTSGQMACIELCYELSSKDARVVLVGVPRAGEKISIYTLPLHFGKTIKGTEGGGSLPNIDIPVLLDLLDNGNLELNDFPRSTYPLTDINTALRDLRSGFPGRMVIDFGA